MTKVSPSWMGLLAAELGCCCWVFVSSPLRAEMVYANHGSDIVRAFAESRLMSKKEQEGSLQMAFQVRKMR